MPNFENLDQYETRNPRSGKKEIVPIAPHSMQAEEFRPRKSRTDSGPIQKNLPEFAEIEFEPISVQQMEREFRAAGRKRRRLKSLKSKKSWLKRLMDSIRKIFGGKKKPKISHRGRDHRRGPSDKRRESGNNQQRGNQQNHAGKGKSQRKRPQRKKAGQHHQKPNSQQQGSQHKSPNQPRAEGDSKDANNSGQKSSRRRNRRNRGRNRPSGQSGNSQSSDRE